MVQQRQVIINSINKEIIFRHDDAKFIEQCNECIAILNKAKELYEVKLHAAEVDAKPYDQYLVTIHYTNSKGKEFDGQMSISYTDLIEIIPLDKDNCLDIVYITEHQKFELYKYLLTRI